ncbi:MAG: MCE-family protein Mce1D [Acidimicrobiales bacterium]|nr:MCE-family protein Mce1D [Acidimicrobiales bacterium]
MNRRRALRGVRHVALALAALLIALVLPSCGLIGPPSGGFDVRAEFVRGTGLYPGSPVRVLGINVGRITAVKNVGDHVNVTLHLNEGAKVPADAQATIVPLTLLGERYVQLAPAWQGGPKLQGGAVIPRARTRVPVEIDELLRGLKSFMGALDPKKTSDVVTKLATLLDGQGTDFNHLISNASGTLGLLADKGKELNDIIGSLGELSATLRGRTSSIESLVRNYNLVSQVLIDNRGDLDASVQQLDRVAQELTALLEAHKTALRPDVAEITRVGRTLTRNLGALDITLASTVKLFEAAGRAYDPTRNVLNVNNQLNPGFTSELLAARLRDRIAGLCRRLKLPFCSSPTSPFYDGLTGLIPSLITGVASGTGLQPAPQNPSAAPQSPPPSSGPPSPTLPSLPQAPAAPAAPSADALIALLLAKLTAQLGPNQRTALGQLDPARLQVLLGLDPVQLAILPKLTPAQLDQLRLADPATISDLLNRFAAQLQPPSSLLDPLLPPLTSPGGGGIVGLPPALQKAYG